MVNGIRNRKRFCVHWPWVQSIRAYVQHTEAEKLIAEIGPGAADIAEIIPEVRQKLPGLVPSPALEPEQARFRLFDSIANFLKNAAQSQPLLLVLDDLHWADKPSLLLLEFLARLLGDSRILIVGCYRNVELSRQHPLSETLGQLAREPVFQRELLRGLTREETGRFIETAAGADAPDELVAAVYSHTEGNPFFMTEIIRLMLEQGNLTGQESVEGGNIRIPEGVKEVIGRRLNRLSDQCNQALTTASVIGREFDFRLLSSLTGDMSEDQLLGAVDEAVSAQLIEEIPNRIERFQFTHALIQQTLAEELTTTRRVRLHARIGEALEELYGEHVEEQAAELAHHFAEAESLAGPEKLVHYSSLAGELALSAFAYEEAESHFHRALEAKGVPLNGLEPAPDVESAALLYGLGRSQAATSGNSVSKMREAIGSLKRAFEHYRLSDQWELALQVAKYPLRPRIGYRLELKSLIEPALELAEQDSPEAAQLFTAYGSVLGLEEGRYDEARDAFSRALAIAERCCDVSLEMGTLANAANVHYFHGNEQEALRTSLRAIDLSAQVNDPRTELAARYIAVLGLLGRGNLQDAARHATAMLDLAEKIRDHLWLYMAYWQSEEVSTRKGDWHAARSFSDRALSVSPGAPTLLSTRVFLEYQLGQFGEGARFLERLLDAANAAPNLPVFEHATVADIIPVIARITGVSDHFDLAEKAAETVLSSPQAPPVFSMRAQAGLALMAVIREDSSACEMWYNLIMSMEEFVSYPLRRSWLLGLLSQTTGNLDQAVAHFEDALAFCRKAGYRAEVAWVCCDYSDALRERNDVGDRAKAMALLGESLAISTDLGMRPLMERVEGRIEQFQAQPSAAPAYPGGLTEREVEVLRLIAAGKTNLEIAEELVIAEGTARRHVANIYEKIGAANRVEAASYAAHNGITS